MSDTAHDRPGQGPGATLKRTPFYSFHKALGARLIDFGGWEMPVQYPTGILEEHRAVREAIGLFDISHMGVVSIVGPDAAKIAQRLFTNDISRLQPGHALYTVTLREDGGIVEDCIVYRVDDEYRVIVNASNREKDLAHFQAHAKALGANGEVRSRFEDFALLAVQGPKALELIGSLSGGRLPAKSFTYVDATIGDRPVVIARTGYTGEDGVELMIPRTPGFEEIFQLLLDKGAAYGLKPIGLGARDTLRLEARLSLYGNDIDEDHNPIEAGLGWVVKGKGYVGEEAIERVRAEGVKRKLVGFKVHGRGIARHGYTVHRLDGEQLVGEAIGVVTSGTVAPTVGGAVGMAWVPAELADPGTRLGVDCRGRPAVVEIVKGPFYKRAQ